MYKRQIPEVTDFVLKELDKWNAKATFFCVGDNILKHQSIFEKIINNKHTVANHTFNHLNGLGSNNDVYLKSIYRCEEALAENNTYKLFRPPYGKLKFNQYKKIKKEYKVILWHILAGDFLKNMTSKKCLNILKRKTKKGSIIVLHDNMKTFDILKEVLPAFLAHFTKKGFQFKALTF